ncbi:MAG TPA: glycosyltransferase family 4 protein [Acidimicrobiales bacterium]|nr:glycosyltransferase family 4 protein [Acidimicrobiales bacterium]
MTYVVDSETFGGAEQTVIQLVERLPGGFATTVVATAPVPRQLAAAATRYGRLVAVESPRNRRRRTAAVRKAVTETHPDLVHLNLVDPATNLDALRAVAALATPSVATVHMIGGVGDARAAASLGSLYRGMDHIFVVSAEIERVLTRRLAVPAAMVEILPNGVARCGVMRHANRGPGPVRIGGVGRLTAQKGWDVLLAALELLVEECIAVELQVIGEGRDRRMLEALVGPLPASFGGHRDDVMAFLGGIDVFCLPSRAEGLPLALLEAMMAGVPCVSTAVGAIPQAVGGAVELVPPGDAAALARCLKALCGDPERRERLGRAGAELARRRFHVDATVRRVADRYHMLRRRSPPSDHLPVPKTSR